MILTYNLVNVPVSPVNSSVPGQKCNRMARASFLKKIYLLTLEKEEGGKRERKTLTGCLPYALLPGTEPAT